MSVPPKSEPELPDPWDRALRCVQFVLCVATGLQGLSFAFSGDGGPGIVFAIVSSVALCTWIFRWGWLVPCTLAGIAAGFFSDLGVKGGPVEVQMIESVAQIGMGTFLGMLAGFLLDLASRESPKPESRSTDLRPPVGDHLDPPPTS